jgi:hypothetical protein
MRDPVKRLDFKQVAARDLADHMSLRLATIAQDFMDRCATVGIENDEATLLALNTMLSYSASAALALQLNERGFALLCKKHYEKEQEDETTG